MKADAWPRETPKKDEKSRQKPMNADLIANLGLYRLFSAFSGQDRHRPAGATRRPAMFTDVYVC